jgi:Holliday junction resolvasome RuvABC DNA-binding subunit
MEVEDMSEIYVAVINKNHEYILVCNCGQTYAYDRKRAIISRMIKKGHAVGQVACHKCKNDKLTLYIFENGIISDLSNVDYELYYQTFGGIKL